MWFGIGPQGQAVFGLPGNPGLDAGVPDPLRRCPAIAAAMGAQRIGRRNAWPSRRPVTVRARARPTSCPWPSSIDDWGRAWAYPAPDQRLRRFPEPRRHRRIRRNAARAQYLPERLRHHACTAGNLGAMTSAFIDIRGAQNPLDRLGRPLHDLRISVMDRCNFRCPYCMPKEQFHEHYRFLKSQRAAVVRGDRAPRAPVRAARRAQAAPDRRRTAAARRTSPIWSAT